MEGISLQIDLQSKTLSLLIDFHLIFQELLAYILIYLLVNLIYRKVLIPNSQCNIRDNICEEVRQIPK